MNENEMKYMETCKRLFFDGEYDTEKGMKLLERKRRLLKIEEVTSVKIEIEQRIEGYNEYIGLLDDILEGKEFSCLSENEKKEVLEFRRDLNITDDEAEQLEGLRRRRDLKKVEQAADIKENSVQTLRPQDNDECFKISGANFEIILSPKKENERFYFDYKIKGIEAEQDFRKAFMGINSVDRFTEETITGLFDTCFDNLFGFAHKSVLVTGKRDTFTKNDAKNQFDLAKLRKSIKKIEQVRLEVVECLNQYDLAQKAGGSSSSTMAVGSLGFMATVGAMQGIGKIFSGISNAYSANKFKNQVNSQALEYIKEQYDNDFKKILHSGIIRSYNYLAKILGLDNFEENQKKESDAKNIIENFACMKETEPVQYVEKMLKVLWLDRTNSMAYWNLLKALEKENIAGKLDVLNVAIENVLFNKGEFEQEKKLLIEKQNEQKKLEEFERKVSIIDDREISDHFENVMSFSKCLHEQIMQSVGENEFFMVEKAEAFEATRALFAESFEDLKRNIIAFHSSEKAVAVFTYGGLYYKNFEQDEIISIAYSQISQISQKGLSFISRQEPVNFSADLFLNETECHIFVKVINALKECWRKMEEDNELSLIKLASEISATSIDKIIGKFNLPKEDWLIQFKYVEPKKYFLEQWGKMASEKYPSEEDFVALKRIQEKLGISNDQAIELKMPLSKKWYAIKASEVSNLQLKKEEIKEKLSQYRNELEIWEIEANEIELECFGKGITTDENKYAFIDAVLIEYAKLGDNPFGDRFWGLHEDIPEAKLDAAMNEYVKKIDEDEFLLFYYDDTILGGGEDGFCITDKYFYTNKINRIELHSISNFELYNNVLFVETTNDMKARVSIVFISEKEKLAKFLNQNILALKVPTADSMECNSTAEHQYGQQIYQVVQACKGWFSDVDPDVCTLGDNLNKSYANEFVRRFNKTCNYGKINRDEILAYFKCTIFSGGDSAVVILKDSICSTSIPEGRWYFKDMTKEPENNEGFISDEIVVFSDKKVKIQLLGNKKDRKAFGDFARKIYFLYKNGMLE